MRGAGVELGSARCHSRQEGPAESFKAEKMLLVVVWDCQRLMCVPAPCRGERNIDFEGCRPSVKIDLLGGEHWFYHYFKHEGMNG